MAEEETSHPAGRKGESEFIASYTFGKFLGKGAFSVVKQCTHKESNKKFAVKIIAKKKLNENRQLENEIQILKQARSHPNIVQLHEVIDTPETLYLILELIEGGELYEELISYGPFEELKVFQLFKQIVDAVDYLHLNKITHRDLKLENILVTDTLQVKLTDFGLSNYAGNGEMMQKRCGTPTYAAPELIKGEKYSSMVDLWALGVCLYLLIFCEYPFTGDSLSEVHEKVEANQADFPAAAGASQEVQDLIKKLLVSDPEHRFTISDIRGHPWMKKHLPGSLPIP